MRGEPIRGGRGSRAWTLALLALAACGGGVPAAPVGTTDVLGPARLGMAESELRASLRDAGIRVRCTEGSDIARCAWRRPDATLRLEYLAHRGRVIAVIREIRRPPGGPPVASIYARERERLAGASGESDVDGRGMEGVVWEEKGTLLRNLVCLDVPDGGTFCKEMLAAWVEDDGGASELPLPDSTLSPLIQ